MDEIDAAIKSWRNSILGKGKGSAQEVEKSWLVQGTEKRPVWLEIINTEKSSMSFLWRSKQGSRPLQGFGGVWLSLMMTDSHCRFIKTKGDVNRLVFYDVHSLCMACEKLVRIGQEGEGHQLRG